MTKDTKEPHDYHNYYMVNFSPDVFHFFFAAVKFYESLLQQDLKAIDEDDDLKTILGKSDLESFPINEELKKTHNVIDWFNNHINERGENAWSYHPDMSHQFVRFIKSVSILYLEHLNRRRNVLSSRPTISKSALEAVDQKLSALEEKIQAGVFHNASPYPLIVSQLPEIETVEQEISPSIPPIRRDLRPRPVIIDSIAIMDRDLRQRCLDLFTQFREGGQHERLDTVVNEATRILEDRLRSLSSASATCIGVDLAKHAFGQPPTLIVSDVPAEQEAAHLLFRGVFGFIRNSVHHRLVGTLQPERVLQIVGMIDYLLFISEGARREPVTP